MHFTHCKVLTTRQKIEVLELWNSEYPKALSLPGLSEFDEYLQGLSGLNHILLCDEDKKVSGWLIYFIRDDEQCFAMLLDSSLQGQGWGSKLLNLAKAQNTELNGWVVDNSIEPKQNGEHYKSPIDFYRKNGFEIRMDVQMKKKNINGIKVTWKSTTN